MTNTSTKIGYIPSIDGIRGVLSFFLLYTHWDLKNFNLGWVVLGLFFMITGFLIGRILVYRKHEPFKEYYGKYIINRILRILPLYYFSIFLVLMIIYFIKGGDEKMSYTFDYYIEHINYFLFYGVNLIMVFNPADLFHFKGYNFLGHFWSLAVEEQFYFFFPLLIFFFKKRALQIICVLTIIGLPFLKLFAAMYLENLHTVSWARFVIYENTVFWLDAFAIGTAMAVFDIKKIKFATIAAYLTFFLTIFVGLYIYWVSYSNGYTLQIQNLGMDFHVFQFELTGIPIIDYRFIIMSWLMNISFAFIIIASINENAFSKVLKSPAMIFIGKRCYGMYVYHLPILILLWYYGIITHEGVNNSWLYKFGWFIPYYLFVLLISDISYRYFEKKILLLKKKY